MYINSNGHKHTSFNFNYQTKKKRKNIHLPSRKPCFNKSVASTNTSWKDTISRSSISTLVPSLVTFGLFILVLLT